METSELILQKAWGLFKRFGIRSVTMGELASQCGISKKTLYQCFTDKDHLVGTIIEQSISRSTEHCSFSKAKSDNAIHEIFQSMQMFQEMFEGVHPAMIYDLKKYHPLPFSKLEQHKRQFLYENTKSNILRGIEEGIFRPELDVEVITQLHLVSMLLLFEQGEFPQQRHTVIDVQWEVMLHYMYGIANAKGVKLIEKYNQQRLKL